MMPESSLPLSSSQLRALLAQHIAQAPPLEYGVPLAEASLNWLAKAEALIHQFGDMMHTSDFRIAAKQLSTYNHSREAIMLPLLTVFKKVELRCPADEQGMFIAPGETWEGYAAVVRLLSSEADSFLIVDPYIDGNTFCELAPHVSTEGGVKFLTTKKYRASLQAAFEKWSRENDHEKVSAEIRYAGNGVLHDRLVMVEPDIAWSLSQSLKDIARKSPASLVRLDHTIAKAKVDFYTELWAKCAD